jgi:hypothetical protein
MVAQVIKKFPELLLNPQFHYNIHMTPPLNPILSQFTQVYIVIVSFLKVHYIICRHAWSFPLRVFLMRASFPVHLIFLHFVIVSIM